MGTEHDKIRVGRACVDLDKAIDDIATEHALSYSEIVHVMVVVAATHALGRVDEDALRKRRLEAIRRVVEDGV